VASNGSRQRASTRSADRYVSSLTVRHMPLTVSLDQAGGWSSTCCRSARRRGSSGLAQNRVCAHNPKVSLRSPDIGSSRAKAASSRSNSSLSAWLR
jgi:hypothetical protein